MLTKNKQINVNIVLVFGIQHSVEEKQIGNVAGAISRYATGTEEQIDYVNHVLHMLMEVLDWMLQGF